MAEFYVMPSVSPTMELGTIVSWQVAEGTSVQPQTVLAEVGTDKANMDAEIFDSGVVIKLLVDEGAEVPPGFPIAIIGGSLDEDIAALMTEFEARQQALAAGAAATPTSSESSAVPAPAPASAPLAAPAAPAAPTVAPSADRSWMGRALSTDFMDPPGDLKAGRRPKRVAASPLAKAVAAELGVALGRVRGSGPGGRIVRADVEAAQHAPPGVGAARADEAVKNNLVRKTIARRLTASHQDIPTFFLTAEYDAAGFVAFRKALEKLHPDARSQDLVNAYSIAPAPPASVPKFGKKEVEKAIRSFPTESAGGYTGMRPAHLKALRVMRGAAAQQTSMPPQVPMGKQSRWTSPSHMRSIGTGWATLGK